MITHKIQYLSRAYLLYISLARQSAKCYFHSYFIHEENKAQRYLVTCPSNWDDENSSFLIASKVFFLFLYHAAPIVNTFLLYSLFKNQVLINMITLWRSSKWSSTTNYQKFYVVMGPKTILNKSFKMSNSYMTCIKIAVTIDIQR